VKNKDAGELVTAGQVKLIRRLRFADVAERGKLLSNGELESRNKSLSENSGENKICWSTGGGIYSATGCKKVKKDSPVAQEKAWRSTSRYHSGCTRKYHSGGTNWYGLQSHSGANCYRGYPL
jgi:hypothetical protein